MRLFPKLATHDEDEGVEYVPYVNKDGQVGYRCTSARGVHYVFMNPSTGGDPPANIFVYRGASENIEDAEPVVWFESEGE